MNLSLTPTYTYTRADCPQYGQLKGPSCFTAPLIAVKPGCPRCCCRRTTIRLLVLSHRRAPWSDPTATSSPWGRRLVDPNPDLTDHNPQLPWFVPPATRIPGTANPDDAPPPPPPTPRPRSRRDRARRHRARRRQARRCPPRRHRPPSAGTSALLAANRSVTSLASSLDSAVRRRWPPSCCWVRWRAARRFR